MLNCDYNSDLCELIKIMIAVGRKDSQQNAPLSSIKSLQERFSDYYWGESYSRLVHMAYKTGYWNNEELKRRKAEGITAPLPMNHALDNKFLQLLIVIAMSSGYHRGDLRYQPQPFGAFSRKFPEDTVLFNCHKRLLSCAYRAAYLNGTYTG